MGIIIIDFKKNLLTKKEGVVIVKMWIDYSFLIGRVQIGMYWLNCYIFIFFYI